MTTTKYTNLITLTDADAFDKYDTASYDGLTGVAGTNTITATGPASLGAYAANQKFIFIPANSNSGATTLNITQSGGAALGAKNVFANNAACVGGEIRAGVPCLVIYDGTQFHLFGVSVTSIVVGTPSASDAAATKSFTIASGCKAFEVAFIGHSTSGTSPNLLELGDAGGVEASGVSSSGQNVTGATAATSTAGFIIGSSAAAASLYNGIIRFTLVDATNNTWAAFGGLARNDGEGLLTQGTKSLSAAITSVLWTTVGGTDTRDAGSISVTQYF